ncbi:hypothetical protein B0H17DRAFT_1127632 [Mycena rosella]|uniref:Glutathione S-transferase UstS-like C-terminal domain-containing protein n=1 Tax=Mycena rosella TaxID=1033263 RepID=A0AAD7DYG1_MYCRO|nr:hypothetical protein B0H17DRAFT_1127632 [Mycena rosella]
MYPDKPLLMPAGTVALHRGKLNPVSTEYFRRTREEQWGKTLVNLAPKGEEDAIQWKKLKDGFGKIDEWILANGPESSSARQMEEVKLWHKGRWMKLLLGIEKHETVV